MVTWDWTPLGLETAAPCQPRAALAVEGSEARWNLLLKVPALHREAESDTTGSFSHQPFLHTWIGGGGQGKRRCPATLSLICRKASKLQLTLWAYCGKRVARRARIRGGPRKSSYLAAMGATVRCSIVVPGCDRRPCGPGRGLVVGIGAEFPH